MIRCVKRHRNALFFVIFTLVFTIIFYFSLKDRIPKHLNADEWRNASMQLTNNQTQKVNAHRLLIVTSLFVPQVVFNAPFQHITKILCGYWFGLLWGWLISVLSELALSFATINLCMRFVDSEAIVEDSRLFLESIRTRTQLITMHLTSLPIQVRIFVVKAGAFSKREFWLSLLIVSAVMSFKNALIGQLLFYNSLIWLALSMTVVFTLLPSLVTLYLAVSGYFNLRKSIGLEEKTVLTEDEA